LEKLDEDEMFESHVETLRKGVRVAGGVGDGVSNLGSEDHYVFYGGYSAYPRV
jgi:hypothetical protein